VWLDQFDQAIPRHDLIHLDQEASTAGLSAHSASAKDICVTGTQPFSAWVWRISPDLEVFFRISLGWKSAWHQRQSQPRGLATHNDDRLRAQ
jgi:hypothetical protein